MSRNDDSEQPPGYKTGGCFFVLSRETDFQGTIQNGKRKVVLSTKPFPQHIPAVEYDEDCQVRRVKHKGDIRWNGKTIYIAETLAGELIGLTQRNEREWDLWFSFHHLGVFDDPSGKVIPQSKGITPEKV